MKTSLFHSTQNPPRARAPRRNRVAPRWAWHYRTLLALRDHFAGATGDREREPCEPLEPPSLHFEDFSDEVYDRELARALASDASVGLREIEAALTRIRAGTYGRCEATGRRIPSAQLRALPWRRTADHAKPRRSRG